MQISSLLRQNVGRVTHFPAKNIAFNTIWRGRLVSTNPECAKNCANFSPNKPCCKNNSIHDDTDDIIVNPLYSWHPLNFHNSNSGALGSSKSSQSYHPSLKNSSIEDATDNSSAKESNTDFNISAERSEVFTSSSFGYSSDGDSGD